ncbi:MAG: PAS domain S-box protein [Bdellovibrionales bacterium]
MLDAPVNFTKRQTPDPDWRKVNPELTRASRGRRLLVAAGLLGVLVNAVIGGLGVLMPRLENSWTDLERGYWVSAMLAVASAVMLFCIVWAARRQSSEQAMLMEVFHGVTSPQVVVDQHGHRMLANRAYTAWLGDRGEDVERVLYQYFSNDAQAIAELERLAQGARQGQLLTSEVRHRMNNGDVEWRRIVARPLHGWKDYVIWRLEDVSERRRIEERLREEQNKLLDFLSQAPVGIFSVDQTGRFIFANQTLADWLGCTPDDLLRGDIKLHDVMAKPPLNAPPFMLTNGPEGERRGDLILKGLQGRSFPVSITQTVVKSADGLEVRTRSVVRDLTPEQRWQEALSLSEQRFQRLFTDAPVGIVLVDDQTRVIECNQTFAQLVSATIPEILSRDFTDLLPATDRDRVRERLQDELSANDVSRPFEIVVGTPDRQRALQVFVRRFTTAQTTRGGLMLHFIDATEQKKLQQQFVQSQKMQAVGQLAGGIAHDFNNLLTAMIGFCDLLLLRHKPGDQSFSDLMQIKQNANRAANLVRQLLAFSRQQTMQPTVLNLTDELADLSNLLRRLIGANIVL